MAYYQNYFSFLQPSGTPQASGLLFSAWNARKALAALVLFVGRRYYLRLISCPWTAAGYWTALWRYWTARRAHSGYSCTCVRWQRDERAMSVRCVSVEAPENLGFLGRAEALVASRFSGAVSAMRLKCRMRVQNYCKKLDKIR